MDPVEGTDAPTPLSPGGRLRALSRTQAVAAAAVAAIVLGAAVVAAGLLAGGTPDGSPAPAASELPAWPPVTAPPVSPAPASTSGSASASPSPSVDLQQQRFAAAEEFVRARPGIGVVVHDRQTGQSWRAGITDQPMWTSSTIELAMAVSVLERGRSGEIKVDDEARRQVAAMLHDSDNDAADALWKRYGGAGMTGRFQQVYGMTGLTFVAGFDRYWAFLKCTVDDLHRMMTYVLEKLDPTDRAYVVSAMRRVASIQHWGVWAAGAALTPGTKNGWSIETDANVRHWSVSTVGFVGPGERYTVAAMYHVPPGSAIGVGVHAVSDLVATVFGATVPAPVTVPDPSTGQ